MHKPNLQIPSDTKANELYFNPQNFEVAFRPKESKMGTSKSALRVVVQYFGEVIEDRIYTPGTKVFTGNKTKNHLPIPVVGLAKNIFFIHYTDQKAIHMHIPKDADGVIQTRDHIARLSEIKGNSVQNVTLHEFAHETKGVITFGALQIYFEEIEKPQKALPLPFAERFSNTDLYRWLALSVLLHALLLLLLYLTGAASPEEKVLEDLPQKYQKILVQPATVKPYQPLVVTQSLSQGKSQDQDAAKMVKRGQGREGAGARAAGEEGRRGRSTASSPVTRPSEEKVKNAGVLSFFTKQQSQGGDFDDLVDGSVQDVARDLRRSDTGRTGLPDETKVRDGQGLKGSASGGGSTASIGRGLATQGRGGGVQGDGLADFGTGSDRQSVVARIDEDQVSVIGTLTQAQINEVIMKYWGQIQYCYEREIIRQPNLEGKIWVRFTIGLTGRVTQADIDQTTMNSPPVENCVTSAFRRIPFPSPGGSIVEAVYPINFRVAG